MRTASSVGLERPETLFNLGPLFHLRIDTELPETRRRDRCNRREGARLRVELGRGRARTSVSTLWSEVGSDYHVEQVRYARQVRMVHQRLGATYGETSLRGLVIANRRVQTPRACAPGPLW